MTIKECIDRVDNLNPNQYSEEQKVDWLSRLDHQIFTDIIMTHEPILPPPTEIIAISKANPLDQDTREKEYLFPKPEFKPYSPENMAVKLIAPFPYDELYIAYLQMKIDEANKETAQYNNDAILFNTYYTNYASHYNKEHMPINKARWNMWRR